MNLQIKNKKSISVAIIGKPNAGKSLLVNKLVKQKVAAVTYKAQTTRNLIRGIICKDNIQITFIDSPGIFTPKKEMEKLMVKAAWSSIKTVDLIVIVIDKTKILDEFTKNIINKIHQQKLDYLIVLNKIDKDKSQNTEITKEINILTKNIINISAKTEENFDQLIEYIKSKATNPGWQYDEDIFTSEPIRFIAEEITREQLYLNLSDELPYELTVKTDLWEEKQDKSIKICQSIIVSSNSYKKIIIGHKGQLIKKIGINARKIIESELDIKPHLFLFVKVRQNWANNQFYLNN